MSLKPLAAIAAAALVATLAPASAQASRAVNQRYVVPASGKIEALP